jgi:hypothetical protein
VIQALFRYLGPLCLVSSAALLAQSFKNPLIIPTGTDPLAVAMADVNGDGHPDILYVEANYSGGALHVLTGSGAGTFHRTQDVPLPSGVCYTVCYINIGDINGDGVPDVVLNAVVTGTNPTGGAVAALLGNGDGTFQTPIVSTFTTSSYSALTTTGKIGIGDLNGDGAADLVLPDPYNGQIDVLLGDKTGHFHLGGSVTDQSYPIKAILHDVNGDGHLDLITLSAISGQAYVAFGKGDGTFATGTSYTTGQLSPIFYDVDGDGIPDLVFAQYDATNQLYDLVYSKGNTDGTFATAAALTTILPQQLLDIGDYTGDGRADLLISLPSGFGVYPRKSDGTYAPVVQTAASAITRSSVGAVGDINGDSHPDIAVAIAGGIAVFLGNGDGSFQSADVYDLGHPVNAAALVSFTGSSIVNIALQQPATFPRLLLGDGTGSFKLGPDPNSSYGNTAATGSLLAGDFNGDGNTDLFETGFQATSPSVLFGQSPGSFNTPTTEGSTAQLVADLNHDGRADLILANSSGLTIQLGQANNTFLVQTMPPRVSTFAAAVAQGDLNGDGKPDLIVSTESGLDVYLGNGDGTFTFSNQILQTGLNITGYPSYTSAAIADINGDGKPDLVYVGTFQQNVSSTIPHLVVLPGNGDGTFGTPMVFTLQHPYTSLQVADVNRDGKPDLVLSDGSALGVLMNSGNGAFGAEEPLVAGTFVGAPVVGDVNGDGYPDIVVPNYGGTTVTVLLNKVATTSAKLLAATLTVSPEPSAYGQPITASLTTSAQPQPTGTVSFFSDQQFLGAATLSAGTAAFTYAGSLANGNHVISAAYSGDAVYNPASFTDLHSVGDPTYATSTALTPTPSSTLATQTVRLVAKVTVTAGGPSPTGYVTFVEGSASLGTALLDSTGTAFLDTSTLSVGTHSIIANFLGAQVSTYPTTSVLSPSSSAAAQVTVSALPTSTTLVTSSSTGTAGTVLSFTATVSSTNGTPFGGVTFFDGTQTIGTIALTGNQAVFSTASLTNGSHSITAQFNANNTFASSSSAASPVSVRAAKRELVPTLTMVQTQSLSNGTAQLTATVSPATAGGNVTFLADGVILGSTPVNPEGVAQISGFAASGAIHSVTASLNPTAAYAPSASPTSLDGWLTNTPSFTLNLNTQSVVVAPGKSTVVQLSAIGLTQMTGTVSLSCIVPDGSGYACSLGSQTLAYGASTPLSITAPSALTIARHGPPAYLACLALFLLIPPLRKGRKLGALLVVTLFASTALVGCGSVTRDVTPASAVLRVQATSSASATTVRSIEVFINP